jgi:integrase
LVGRALRPDGDVRYSRLAGIVAAHTRNKRTYNNVISAVRCAFDFGYKDHPEKHNPATGLKTLRIARKDRLPIEPFSIEEGERIIAESHAEFGQAHGNFEEFRFFTGLRQSEQMALRTSDCNLAKGTIRITKSLVRGREKDRTKTREDRQISLCGRALEVLKRQLALLEQLARAGKLVHDYLFCTEDGAPIQNLSYPYDRWRYVLLVAKEDGHSPHTMLTTYAAWTEGATQIDVEAIRQSMERSPELARPA